MFAGGFNFSLPAVDRFEGSGVDVDAGGEVFLEEEAGDFAGFGEGGAGDEDEAELGVHGFLRDIVVDLRKEKRLTQRRGGRREDQEKRQRKSKTRRKRLWGWDRKSPTLKFGCGVMLDRSKSTATNGCATRDPKRDGPFGETQGERARPLQGLGE